MSEFYHINKTSHCKWKVGDEISFGEKNNYLWETFAKTNDYVSIDGEKYDVEKISYQALNAYKGLRNPPIEMKNYHFNPIGTLEETTNSLFNTIRNCRELAFEMIRKEYYNELPSRQKCIWLIPNEKKSLEFWNKTINSKTKRIYKVSAEGKIHKAAQKWVIGGTFSLEKWFSYAHNYWQGKNVGSIEDEYLFVGKIRILEEIPI